MNESLHPDRIKNPNEQEPKLHLDPQINFELLIALGAIKEAPRCEQCSEVPVLVGLGEVNWCLCERCKCRWIIAYGNVRYWLSWPTAFDEENRAILATFEDVTPKPKLHPDPTLTFADLIAFGDIKAIPRCPGEECRNVPILVSQDHITWAVCEACRLKWELTRGRTEWLARWREDEGLYETNDSILKTFSDITLIEPRLYVDHGLVGYLRGEKHSCLKCEKETVHVCAYGRIWACCMSCRVRWVVDAFDPHEFFLGTRVDVANFSIFIRLLDISPVECTKCGKQSTKAEWEGWSTLHGDHFCEKCSPEVWNDEAGTN